MLENLTYFLNGASLSFFAMGAFHMAIYARQSKSRPHYLFTICLIWMALIELKEFFLSHDAAYNYEILGPGFTFPDLFTLALLSLFFFELVMPGRITARYSLKLLSPFVLLGGAYWLGTAFEPRTVYASLPELLKDLPSFLPTVLLLYTLYTVGYCLFALTRIVLYSIRYSREIAQAYSFTERIHLQWLRWMSALLAFYLLSYIIIILFFSNIWFTILIYILTLTVWGILYGCILQYRIPDIIRDYWQPLPEEEPIEENPEINLAEGKGRAASLREQLQEAIVQRKLYLNPGLTIIDLACECGTNRTQLSLLLNKELGLSFLHLLARICPDKGSTVEWFEVHAAAHRLGIPTNATILYGHIECVEHRIDHLDRLRRQQDQTGGFNAFIPLKYRNFGNRMSEIGEVSVTEDLRMLAMSRIYLDNIPHIKAYWVMYGKATTELALAFGADDIDGTIDDTTKIYSMAGADDQRPAMTTEEMRRIVAAAGYRAVERDTFYREIG